jgi:hypothetical protein
MTSLLLVHLNNSSSRVSCVVKWVGSNRKTAVLTPWLANWRAQLTATAPWRCEPQRATTVGHWWTLCGFNLHTRVTTAWSLYNFRSSLFQYNQSLKLKFSTLSGERAPSTHWIRGRVAQRVSLNAMEGRNIALTGKWITAICPVVCCYMDWANSTLI